MKQQMSHIEKKQRNFFTQTYASMKLHQKRRTNDDLPFTKEEFINWFNTQSGSELMFNNWKENGCVINLRPTVDRLDDAIGYVFTNMQLMTHQDNKQKQVLHQGTMVIQVTKDLVPIAIFPSIRVATETLKVSKNRIGKAIKHNTDVNGYYFKTYNSGYFV